MTEYIERGALMQFPIRRDHYDRKNGNKHFINGIETVLEYAENLPAADVAPVVHGRWVDGKCSNCGVDIPTDDAHDAIFENECRFCYYCGAKMDVEDGGDSDEADGNV